MMLMRISPFITRRMLIELIHTMVGLDPQNLSPISSPIILIFPYTRKQNSKPILICRDNQEDVKKKEVSFFKLFRTYPPYEPLFESSVYNDVKIVGDYVWFIKPQEIKVSVTEKSIMPKGVRSFESFAKRFNGFAKRCSIKCDDIICGDYLILGNEVRIRKIVIPRSIADGAPWYKELVLGPIRLIYGYYFATQHRYIPPNIKPYNLDKDLIQRMQNELSQRKRSRYRVDTLNYITWCRAGYEICTDPFAVGEECRGCYDYERQRLFICRDAPGYGYYSYTRKIAPKVYAEFKNVISILYFDKIKEYYEIPLSAYIVRGIDIYSEVEAFSMYLPGYVGLIEIIPCIKPVSPLMKTNGILIMIHEDVIRAFIDTIAQYPSRYVCKIAKDRYVSLLNILLTKYIVYKKVLKGGSGLNVIFDVDNGIIRICTKKISDIVEYMIKEKSNIINSTDFTLFVGKLIAHTLAHVLLNDLASKLNVSLDDLLYIYGCEEKRKGICYIGVFEANDTGAINIDIELKRLFNVENEQLDIYGAKFEKIDIISLANYLKNINRYIHELYEQVLRDIEDLLQDAKETLKISMHAVCEDVPRQCMDVCKDEYDKVLEKLLDILRGNIGAWTNEGFVLDQAMLTQIISYLINHQLNDIALYIAKSTNIKDVQCVKAMIEVIAEKFLNEVVTILQPNYCLDGCGMDIYLERYCTEALFENLLTSRCALRYFLAFIGIDPELGPNPDKRFKVKGEILSRLISAARNKVYIQTAFISNKGLNALAALLSKGVEVILELDIRIRYRYEKYLRDLEELKSRFNNLDYVFTNVPDHGKLIIVDKLIIYTSWNYGTGLEPLQDYVASLKRN